jgi:hypothetical protein
MKDDLRSAIDEVYRPAPGLLNRSMDAVRTTPDGRSWKWNWVAGLAAFLLSLTAIGVLLSGRAALGPVVHRAGPRATTSLPAPVPQPVTRTSPGAQVAWLSGGGPGGRLIGVDPSGRTVGHIDPGPGIGFASVYGTWRSADGATIFTAGADHLTAYSALDGSLQHTYPRAAGQIAGDAFSPDGRWLALLLLNGTLQLEVVDLHGGGSQILAVPHDPNASLPGMSGPPNTIEWGTPVFAPDSTRLVTLTDWGGPARLTTFELEAGKFAQVDTAIDGLDGRHFPRCAGPAMATRVVASGRALVAFCHFDGSVWFFDLTPLRLTGVVRPVQPNPFWLSPIFTPDGHLLYLEQPTGLNDSVQVVDLVSQRLRGPASIPTSTDQHGPFAWAITTVQAGGVATTVPVSPDGLLLYAATANGEGVMALRVPDLQPVRKLAPQVAAAEVWVSGDGQTIYATMRDNRHLAVMRSDGSNLRTIDLSVGTGFVASEHG